MFKPKIFRYEIDWGCCDGREGNYTADNVEELRVKIDLDNILNDDEKRILKYGYFHEFKDDIKTTHFCIDGGFDVYWYKYKVII
ncbi:MAG: hypothetical protein E7D69_13585 [Clostridium celatum]|nr:hypothetical protein [Clostridium celatum]